MQDIGLQPIACYQAWHACANYVRRHSVSHSKNAIHTGHAAWSELQGAVGWILQALQPWQSVASRIYIDQIQRTGATGARLLHFCIGIATCFMTSFLFHWWNEPNSKCKMWNVKWRCFLLWANDMIFHALPSCCKQILPVKLHQIQNLRLSVKIMNRQEASMTQLPYWHTLQPCHQYHARAP